jgi:SAM-dependent methyltransferase
MDMYALAQLMAPRQKTQHNRKTQPLETALPMEKLTCPLCSTGHLRAFLGDERFITNRCGQCGYLATQVLPGHKIAIDYFASVDDEVAYENSLGRMRSEQMQLLLSQLEKLGISSGKLLDVGCGYGWLLVEARRKGFDVYGVEPTQLYHRLKQTLGSKIVSGFFPEASFPGEVFAVVSVIDVIEHVPMDVLPKFLRGVADALADKGIFVIKVPDSSGLIFQVSVWCHRLTSGRLRQPINRMLQLGFEFPHESYFNETNLTRYLNSRGFEVVKVAHHPEISLKTAWNRIKYQHTSSIPARIGYFAALAVLQCFVWLSRKRDALIIFARVKR